VLFHCRRPCPVKSESYLTGVNGNGKIIILCVLCLPCEIHDSEEQGSFHLGGSSEAGGEYKLTYLHSKTGTFSLPEGLMD
jgi:hypothetical protein